MWVSRRLHEEDGFAMVMTMVVVSVMMLFTMGMLATGLHLTDATVRDERWNTALQVAEAGLDHAVYTIGQDDTYLAAEGASELIPVSGGQAEITVDRPADGEVVVYATGWVPSKTATNALKRRIRVAFAPEDVFSFALFSVTGLFVKSGSGAVVGDVFANDGVVVDNTSTVNGSVISATEGVEIGNSAQVTGDVHSGGPAGIAVANSANVLGSAYAQSTSCSGSPGSGEYGVVVPGTGRVHGGAVAWGNITGNVGLPQTPHNCQLAEATRKLPTYTWDPTLYTGEIEYTSVASFQAWADASINALSGVHYVWVDDCTSDASGEANQIDLNGGEVTDDFTLVTNCRIDTGNSFSVNTHDDDAIVNIVVLNPSVDPPAVMIKNQFDVTPESDGSTGPAVLLYSNGLIKVNNTAESNGAVYAGAISIKNALEITYDPRVERSLGFGDLKYDRMSWQECRAAAIDFDC
jgi:hypothetical protein